MSIPNPCMRSRQRGGVKPGITAKGRPNHPDQPAQGKMGRVTAKESSMRLRYYRLPERWLTKTAIVGHETRSCITSLRTEGRHTFRADTMTPEYRRHPIPSFLPLAERGNPDEVWPCQ